MASIRVGVVGVGFGSVVHVPAFQSEGLEVAAICARRPERAQEAADRFDVEGVYTDYTKMLAHPGLDAVSVATQAGLHYEMALAALDAGKHVLCEKPFTATVEQAEQLASKADSTGLTAMVAHEFRYSPSRAYIKELIEQGFIGDPQHLTFSLFLNRRRPVGPGARLPNVGSAGMLGALGSHYIDCMRDWFGDISNATGNLHGHPPEGEALADANTGFTLQVEFANGAWGNMACSFVSPFGQGARLEVYGTEGSLQTTQRGPNPNPDGVVVGGRTNEDESPVDLPIPDKFRPFEDDRDDRLVAFRILTRLFVKGIEEGWSPAPNFHDALACQRVMNAVQSAGEPERTPGQVER